MARENAKKREAIFSAFESIPETFAMAVEKRKIFQQYGHVQQQVASLHGTIVHSIIVLISFLLPDRRGEFSQPNSRGRWPKLACKSFTIHGCHADRGHYDSSLSSPIH